VAISLQWKGEPESHHRQLIETANQDGFLAQALCRIHPSCREAPPSGHATADYLATGGAMVVYKITVQFPHQTPYDLIAKIPRERRIVYARGTEQQSNEDSTQALFERLAQLAEHLSRKAPGLFPRCGGIWLRQLNDGTLQHALFEEFIAGLSVERLKHHYEELHLAGQLPSSTYHQQLVTIQRLAIAAFIRLWDALGRHTFTSDPSPWNVLIRDTDGPTPQPTIIDLHSLEENTDLSYVIQRMAAVYGNRTAIIEDVLIPGVIDGLGQLEGVSLLQEALPALEAHAEQTRRNLGVDLQQPLLEAIRRLN
jgi:hypothetical protein